MYNINDVVYDNDNDIAIIEKREGKKFLLRFITQPVCGVAYWYNLGRFKKIKNKKTINESKNFYNYLKNNNKFKAF